MLYQVPEKYLIDGKSASSRNWDCVIVGAGMGGANAAYVLTRAGCDVLLIEKGNSRFDAAAASGVENEQTDSQERLACGKWPTQLRTSIGGQVSDIWAPLGCGLGGSTLLYAASLQRLNKTDFQTQKMPDGRQLNWPFSYEELEPHYRAVEAMFSVCGTPDPLEPEAMYDLCAPPAMCESDQHFFQQFREAGLNPYRLHAAMKYQPGCGECGGRLCASLCKRDAFNSCLTPALDTGRLHILERTAVERLNADDKSITSVEISSDSNENLTIRGRTFVLAAGAYFSPALLLNSRNEAWPNGVANGHDCVGRNLMFHASDFIACWQKGQYSRQGPTKTIALRDFYEHEGQKFGELQSTGLTAGYGQVLYTLRLMFDQSPLKKLRPLRQALRIPAYIASKLYGEATIFSTIVEDFPYAENRIVSDPDSPSGMRIEYEIHDELRTRVNSMTKALRRKLKRLRLLPINVGVTLNYGHPCGTLAAGDDERHSVVDKNCKAHALDNLYVADGSFMPTSGGTNPSLTIAANAQRVAQIIAASLRRSRAA